VKKNDVVYFDDYAKSYSAELSKNHRYIPGNTDWYSEYKVRIARKLSVDIPNSILDYGSGVGLSLPYFKRYFQNASICAFDPSIASLEVAKSNNPWVNLCEPGSKFDLVFVAGVVHHISTTDREEEIKKIVTRVNPGGRILIFEHNPFNPITRRLVSTCEFDKDANLVSKRKLKQSFGALGEEVEVEYEGFCLFFPPALRRISGLERMLINMPFGGQYYVQFRKRSIE
jgi:SAM-dependent methyltransferase